MYYEARSFLVVETIYMFILGLALLVSASPNKHHHLLPLCDGWIVACFGAHQNTAFKAVGMFVYSSSASNTSTSDQPVVFVFSAVLCVCALFQLIFLNKGWCWISSVGRAVWTHDGCVGLARHDAVLFLPLYSALLIVASTIMGGVFYQEFHCFSFMDSLVFPIGIIVIATSGVLFS